MRFTNRPHQRRLQECGWYGLLLLVLSALSATIGRAGDATGGNQQQILRPLNKQGTVLLDLANKRLLLKARVVLRKGVLEMLLCPNKTKEHESILAIDSKAINLHAGLLALGARQGKPARFDPKFVPPTGQELQIFVRWKDKAGKEHRVDARNWIRNNTSRYFAHPLKKLPADLKLPDPEKLPLRYDQRTKELLWYGLMTKKQRDQLLRLSRDPTYQKAVQTFFRKTQYRPMNAKWVFVGSFFVTDPMTGKRRYVAEGGMLICVANFPGATIDVAQQSSGNAGNELYEAWTERIPPLETEVTVEIIPVFAPKKPAGKRNP